MLAVTRVGMAEREGVPKRITISSIVYEFALVTAGSIVVAAWGFIHSRRQGQPLALPHLRRPPIAAIVCLHPKIFSRVSTRLLHRFGSDTLPSTLLVRHRPAACRRLRDLVLVAGIGTLCMARSLHPIDASDIPVIISSWSVGYASALLAFFIPGGIGVREGAIAAVLSIAMPTAWPSPCRRHPPGPDRHRAAYAGGSILYARRMPELARGEEGRRLGQGVARPDLVEALGGHVAGELAARASAR